jgi:hypothetical protein
MRQPAVADLGNAGVDIGVLVEYLTDDEVGEEPGRAPRVSGRARHHRIAPDVAVAWEVRRLVKEAVEKDRQVGVVHYVPERP